MPDIHDLIRYENEHSALDFKATQYLKGQHEALLRDVLAMANADVVGARHIIVGVKHVPDGTRNVLGVEPSAFVDASIYQDLVHANIEPQIELEYFPSSIDDHSVGVIRISHCDKQPYMMKKDFGKLRAGDAFVRKGSHQTRLVRADLERILDRQSRGAPKDTDLTVSFSRTEDMLQVELPILRSLILPSDRAAQKIREILLERDEQRANPGLSPLGPRMLDAMTVPYPFGNRPYAVRSDDELRNNLEHVKDIYKSNDLYELFELYASPLNVYIHNNGAQYVDDASVELRIPVRPGLVVADRIHRKPPESPVLSMAQAFTAMDDGYPEVAREHGYIIARSHVGPIKHHRITQAFDESLRIAIYPDLLGETLPVELFIFGRNLARPYRAELVVAVVDASDQAV